LIVCAREEALEQIEFRNIQLQQPSPQGRVIHTIAHISEVQVAAEEGLTRSAAFWMTQ
jgi:hypothetical protein